ncbi:hypothetical protein [Sphingobacterium sp. HSC-15S19]|uniref:hypothetical protein n=1 Tax=Sphingobacterium TaxID=28453 RepID=UPI003D21B13F
MELIILGKTSDDKGTQLEKLTELLLREQGYSKISTNVVNSGASEVDIKGSYEIQLMNNSIITDVIGECKAYSKPISLPDWLKFLGKIFSEEVQGRKVHGCFIALSGVNSNVIGHYNSIKEKRQDIVLLAGEELQILIQRYFGLLDVGDIQAILQHYTEEQPINYSICYYNSCFYWLITFRENRFSLINANGSPVQKHDNMDIQKIVSDLKTLSDYVDLEEIKNISDRAEMVKKYIVCVLLIEGEELSAKHILNNVNVHFGNCKKIFKSKEINNSLVQLVALGLIQQNKNYGLSLFKNDIGLDEVIQFYTYFFYKTVVLKGLMSKNYGYKIDSKVLEYILEIQGGITLEEEEFNQCLKLIQFSPSAFAWGLVPNEMFLNHRHNGVAINKQIDEHDSKHFVQYLFYLFSKEFGHSDMGEYFYSRGLKELEIITTTKIVFMDGISMKNNSHEKIGLFRMDEEYNNQVVAVSMLDADKKDN